MSITIPDGAQLRPVSDLIPYARNARTHSEAQVAQIAASIREFGWTNPVLIDAEGGVIAGHGRLLAARKLGMEAVPVIELAHLTDAQKRAYILADNRLAESAGWDDELLRLELGALREDGFSLELIGFDPKELANLLAGDPIEGLIGDDVAPTPAPPPITRTGDVWILGKHRLICRSATDLDAWEALEIDPGAAVFTSPPYGAGKVAKLRDHYQPGAKPRESFYGGHDDDPDHWPSLMREWTRLALAHCRAVLCNVQMLADNKRELLYWCAHNAENLVDVVVWDKINGAPQMQANVLTNAFEFIFILSSTPGASRAIPGASFHGTKSNIVRIDPKGRNEFADVHRAVMPVELAEWAIDVCREAPMFVDPFGGTGTTLIACHKHRKPARLIELDPTYCDVIVRRWQAFTGEQATREEDGATFAQAEAQGRTAEAANA